jgi:leucyl aminopeptidase
MTTTWTTPAIRSDGDALADLLLWTPDGSVQGPRPLASRARYILPASDRPRPTWAPWGSQNDKDRAVLLAVEDAPTTEHWMSYGGVVLEALTSQGLGSIRLPNSAGFGAPEALEAFLTGVLLHGFRLDLERRTPVKSFEHIAIVIDPGDGAQAESAQMAAAAINRARAWVEQPANRLTPAAFASEAEEALTGVGVQVNVLDLPALETLGCEALLAVARGSDNPPRLVVAEWRGDPARAGWDAALVGKGVTFDSGGLNLKVRPVIEKMKFDMAGAASVLCAVQWAAVRKSKSNIVAVAPMAENAVGSNGYRPGDVIGSLDGLTIEVQNTDAEGRLILADGVTYARQHYNPSRIVDIATLTGAVMSVLHEEFAGLFTTDDGLATELIRAGDAVGEPLWRLPLTSRQDYLVESVVADLANMAPGGLMGLAMGSPTAGAKFIEAFARDVPWAHLDIAGVAWSTRSAPRTGPGASGFGVALLNRWIEDLEQSEGLRKVS